MRKKKIFIIEDQDDIRHLLEVVFQQTGGFEVHAAAEPAACPLYFSDACDCPQENTCGDVLLTDNYLPRMTGLEFIQRQVAKGCKGSIQNKAVDECRTDPGRSGAGRIPRLQDFPETLSPERGPRLGPKRYDAATEAGI